MENTIRILYVDDEAHNLNAFTAHFRINKKYKIHTCRSGEEGLQILSSVPIDIIISDQKMPNMTGVEFLDKIPMFKPQPVKIVVTAHRDVSAIRIALQEGKIFRYHEKPWNLDDLERSIEEGYELFGKN